MGKHLSGLLVSTLSGFDIARYHLPIKRESWNEAAMGRERFMKDDGAASGTGSRLPARDPRGGRPPQEVAARLGHHILETALAQFIASGVEGTSMEAIAAAAQTSKRTLYSRFGSKLALLVAAMEHSLARYLDPIAASVPRGSTRKKIAYIARRMLDLSLQGDVVGIEALIIWLANHNPGMMRAQPAIGTQFGIDLMQTILAEASEPNSEEAGDLPFLAAFLFDALVTVPRQRILQRHDLHNTTRTKAAYIERALDLMAKAIPFLNEGRGNRLTS